MEDYRININYAKALFMVASDCGKLDEVERDMRLVNAVCRENHILGTVFANPVIREGKKTAILKELFGGKVSEVSMLFLSFVVKKRRTVNLGGISNAFLDMYRSYNNIVLSQLVTAGEADVTVRQAAIKIVEQYTGKKVELQSKVCPDIIGGFSVVFDNNMYDARISSQIAKLRSEFAKNVYESKL